MAELSKEHDAATQSVDASNAAEFEAAVAACDPIQVIVNCVGSVMLKRTHLTSDSDWSETLQMNLTTAFHVVRSGSRLMMHTGGSVVLCSKASPPAW
ncbi:MAG: SDR family NAD(P)-dependent oxidoreductase [Bryobacteraceae bacterium]|nr:SDR family NAD(P)-dependent oxidoreductase [Bryobacteraceae bacterium]